MKKIALFVILSLLLAGCHKSLEDQAAEEAREYTRKNCPTPIVNNTRTDSLAFDRTTRTILYYCSFCGPFDDIELIDNNRKSLGESIVKQIVENEGLRKLKKAGFNFKYIVHSQKNPRQVLYTQLVTPKEYR